MNTIIIYCEPLTRKINYCIPNPQSGLSVDEVVRCNVRPFSCEYTVCCERQLPRQREFQEAWRYDSQTVGQGRLPIVIDEEAAKELWKNVWRHLRLRMKKKIQCTIKKAEHEFDNDCLGDCHRQLELINGIMDTPLPPLLEKDTVDTYSKKLLSVRPPCLDWTIYDNLKLNPSKMNKLTESHI